MRKRIDSMGDPYWSFPSYDQQRHVLVSESIPKNGVCVATRLESGGLTQWVTLNEEEVEKLKKLLEKLCPTQ